MESRGRGWNLDGPVARGQRALFYSHDSLGLGHLTRTLLIAEGLNRHFPRLSSLIVTGSAMAHSFRVSPNLDYVKLPSVIKVAREEYASRALELSFEESQRLRREIIHETTVHYEPDFFFVDTVPCGLKGELLKTLDYLRNNLSETRVFLILRDILDDPALLIPAWKELDAFKVLEENYDGIFVCGHQWVYDPVKEYRFPPSVHSKVQFCGYLERSFDETVCKRLRKELTPNGERLVVVTVGGGVDGAQLIEGFQQCVERVRRQVPLATVLLLGPEVSPSRARSLASSVSGDPGSQVLNFSADCLAYMGAADVIVSMGGYNTLNEIIWLRKPAVVSPRVHPRREQLIRARRMARLGLLRMIHPRDLTADLLAEKVLEALSPSSPIPFTPFRFTAVQKIARELGRFIREDARSTPPRFCGGDGAWLIQKRESRSLTS